MWKTIYGQDRREFYIRIKEHSANFGCKKTKKFALAKHSNNTGNQICLEDAKIIVNEDQYTKRKIKESMEIDKTMNNINRYNDFKLSDA